MLEVKVQEHKNNIVKKHNELIKAQGTLSSTAYKMLCSVISMIRIDDTDFQEYALRIDDYLKLIDSKSNNKNFLKEQAKQLMQNPFEIDGKLFNWCSVVDLKKLEGYLVFEVHPKLKPYLLELKDKGNITQYQIINILSLKGDYTPRLYELITSEWNTYRTYNKNSKSYTFEFELDFLRDTLKIPKSYAFGNIKQRILEVAKRQFKAKTNIKFDYKEQKLGNKVVRIQVTVKENNQGSNDIFASRKAFITHIRKEYKPDATKNHFPIVISTKTGDVKVNLNGEIYISGDDIKTLDNKQADKLWDWLYELVKEKPELLQNPNEKNLLN